MTATDINHVRLANGTLHAPGPNNDNDKGRLFPGAWTMHSMLQITGENVERDTTECLPDKIQHCISVKVLPDRYATPSLYSRTLTDLAAFVSPSEGILRTVRGSVYAIMGADGKVFSGLSKRPC